MISLWRPFALCGVLVILSGCSEEPGPISASRGPRSTSLFGSRKPHYSFSLTNRSGVTLTRCDLQWGTYETIGFGQYMSANGHAVFGFANYPVPETAVLTWVAEDGRSHRVEVDVPQIARERLRGGRFCFVILPDHSVKVGAFSKQELFEQRKHREFARDGGPAYSVGAKNATSDVLTSVCVRFGSYKVNGDDINATLDDVNAGWQFTSALPYQVTDVASVQWTTPDGVKHEQEVALKTELPKNLNGVTIAFIIAPGEVVHVKALPWAQREQWMRLNLAELLAEPVPRHR